METENSEIEKIMVEKIRELAEKIKEKVDKIKEKVDKILEQELEQLEKQVDQKDVLAFYFVLFCGWLLFENIMI